MQKMGNLPVSVFLLKNISFFGLVYVRTLIISSVFLRSRQESGPTLIRIRVQEHGRDESHIGVHIARIGHNELRCRVRIIRIIILVVGEVRLLLIRIIIACRVIAIRIAVVIIAAANQRVVVIIVVVIAAAIAVILLMLGQK